MIKSKQDAFTFLTTVLFTDDTHYHFEREDGTTADYYFMRPFENMLFPETWLSKNGTEPYLMSIHNAIDYIYFDRKYFNR